MTKSFFFSCDTSLLCVDFRANLAFLSRLMTIHNKLHAACFASSVFFAAVLSKRAPFEAFASEFPLIAKAHVDDQHGVPEKLDQD
jgi:hypothetical protein